MEFVLTMRPVHFWGRQGDARRPTAHPQLYPFSRTGGLCSTQEVRACCKWRLAPCACRYSEHDTKRQQHEHAQGHCPRGRRAPAFAAARRWDGRGGRRRGIHRQQQQQQQLRRRVWQPRRARPGRDIFPQSFHLSFPGQGLVGGTAPPRHGRHLAADAPAPMLL